MEDYRSPRPAESVIAGNRESAQQFKMSFPKDIGDHGMMLSFKKYNFSSTGAISGTPIGSIVLPIPRNLVESYSVNVKGESMGLIGSLVGDAIAGNVNVNQVLNSVANTAGGSLISDPAAAANYFIQSGLATTATAAAGSLLGSTIGGALAGAAGSSAVSSGLSAASGTALNPHVSVMFEGMNLRSHNFDWSFSPKNAAEGEMLQKIIKVIKKNALPSYQGVGASPSNTALDRVLLRYPNVVDIKFIGLDQSYFFKFKTCMITQVSVDYSQHGNAFFAGAAGSKPVMVNFQLSLIESKIHTADDFDSGE